VVCKIAEYDTTITHGTHSESVLSDGYQRNIIYQNKISCATSLQVFPNSISQNRTIRVRDDDGLREVVGNVGQERTGIAVPFPASATE
jgi:hypothetical protein